MVASPMRVDRIEAARATGPAARLRFPAVSIRRVSILHRCSAVSVPFLKVRDGLDAAGARFSLRERRGPPPWTASFCAAFPRGRAPIRGARSPSPWSTPDC